LAAAILAFAAAGCGGGGDSSSASGTKPETWSADVCGALQTWEDDLKSGSQQLSSDIRSSTDLKSVKQKLVAFLEDAQKSTEKMVSDVKAAGAPAVKDGPAIQQDLESGLTGAQNSFEHAVTQAKKLPTNNPRALTTGLTTLGQTIQSELTATGQHFSNLENKYDVSDLNEAMKDEPACKPFVSSSG
jgi:prophage DNA circulation protein